ncbi:hypothetical protein [Microbacterium arborescens]|uniref:hypothetical protein n=1 Tax=Microbacterium arborescens TaxID=33883 RepID=UPI003C780771
MLPAGGALVAACVATIAGLVVLFALRPHWRRRGRLLRFGVVAALSAIVSSLMYSVHVRTGDTAALVISDVAMTLAPGLVFAGLGSLSGGIAARAGLACLLAAFVGVVTAVVGLPVSLAVKVIAVAVACGLASVAARHPAMADRRGSRLLAGAMGAYGAFSACRAVVGLAVGWDSVLYRWALSAVPTTVAGTILVLVSGTAVIMILSDRRAARVPEWPDGDARHDRDAAWSITLGAFDLVRAAFGAARASRMRDDLFVVARTLDPDAVLDGSGSRTRLRVEGEREAVEDALRTRLVAAGWSPGELGLLSIETDA